MSKFSKGYLYLFFIIFTPIFFLALGASLLFNMTFLYTASFDKYNVSDATQLSEQELKKVASEIQKYFNNGQEYLVITVADLSGDIFVLFDEREQEHMKDVKEIVHLAYGTSVLLLATFVILLFIVYKKKLKEAHAWLIWGGLGTAAAVALCVLLAIADFDSFFNFLHSLFFSEKNSWVFAPDYYLVALFPPDFWIDIGILIGGLIFTGALIMIFIGFWRSGLIYRKIKTYK